MLRMKGTVWRTKRKWTKTAHHTNAECSLMPIHTCTIVWSLVQQLINCLANRSPLFFHPNSHRPKLIIFSQGLATMDCQCCGRQNKRNWTKTAHHTHINVHLGTVQTHTQRCAVTGWTLGLMEASARGGRVIGYPPSASNRSTHNSLHNLVVCVDKNVKSIFDVNRFTVSCNAAARTMITHHRLNSDSSKTPDVHMTATN